MATGITDFRLVQNGDGAPLLTLMPGEDTAGPRAVLEALIQRSVQVDSRLFSLPEKGKLRRVMRIP